MRGKRRFKRLLGAPVFDEAGTRVGRLAKVVLDRATEAPKAIEIETRGGERRRVDPDLVEVEGGRLVLRAPGADRQGDYGNDVIAVLEGYREELERLRRNLIQLDEMLLRGAIERDVYERIRRDYEVKRRAVLRSMGQYIDELNSLISLLEGRRQVLTAELRRGAAGPDELEGVKRTLKKLYSILETYRVESAADHPELVSA